MIALSPEETAGKPLNPSAQNYFPLHHYKNPVGAPKHPHLKLSPIPSPFFFIPPPPQFYLPGNLFQPMPELQLLRQIVWAPVLTHTGFPRTLLPGSGKASAPMVVKNRPVSRRVVPPRLQVWRRKVAPPPKKPEIGNSTTVMIRNIPNRLRQTELVHLLAEHCFEMNKAAVYESEFDLVYLPVDFKKRGNKGYAFVNFTTAAGAAGLYHAWNNLGWKDFQTKKTRLITRAAIQGKARLKARLESSPFDCDTDDYLAVEFTPACNGSNLSCVSAAVVGSRVKSV